MRAQEQTVLNLIGGLDKVFIIPPFQRNYEWSTAECEELFRDIEAAYKTGKSHYLGNVVYYEGRNSGASYNEYILVDGQQRVTTILLLLCAIRDVITDESDIESINKRYLKNDTGDNRFRVRLKQTSYDSESFIAIIDKVPYNKPDNNIIKNYNYFINLIKKSDVSPKELYNTIPKLEVVDVNLKIDNDLNAVQTVFEKINSTGKRLTPADLIRNYLLLSHNAEEQESLYQNYWLKIEQTVKNENISAFARDFLIMNIFEDVTDANVYKTFKSHFNETNATHVSILNDMNTMSKYYAWLKFEDCPNKKINRTITMLNFLKTYNNYPLYLYCFYKLYDSNSSELQKILELLSDFMLRYRIVAPSSGGGALRSIIYQLLENLNSEAISLTYEDILFELSNSSALSGRFPDDEEFKHALMNSVNVNYARALLLKIEEFETKNISVPLKDVTIEHFMPQTRTDWWTNYLGGEDEAQRIYDTYLNCIGNLAPISGPYNAQNSNKPWTKKLELLTSVQFAITSGVTSHKDWKEKDIQERNEDISNRACAAITSPLPRKRKYQTKSPSEEFTAGLYPISDVTTPMSNTNITEILFEDKVIKVSTWKDFLKEICKIAYEFDSERFKSIVLENKIHKSTSTKNYPNKDPIITDDPKLLGSSKEIENTKYYVEGTISSNRARIYVKQLLDIYGITDAFQIQVAD